MTIVRPGEDITNESILDAINDGQRVVHAMARYFGGDNPDDALAGVIYQKLDEMETNGVVYKDPNGLYHIF